MSQSVENPHAGAKWHALLHTSAVRSIVLAVGMVGLSGCDPVRTISHNVTIAVVDAQQMPVHGVSVDMKESWESWRSAGNAATGDAEADRRQLWESDFVPWRKDVTDAQGNAVIALTITGLDRTRGNQPPADRDTVSNRQYIIRVKGKNIDDEVHLVMKPGASAKGKLFSVSVVEIEKPRYVP